MPFQREGVLFGVRHQGRLLIGDEMGLGKTLQALALAWHFRGDWPLLVVAPSSVCGAWIDELEKWLPQLSPTDFHLVRSGTDVGRSTPAPITLVSYALITQPVLQAHLQQRGFGMVILDER